MIQKNTFILFFFLGIFSMNSSAQKHHEFFIAGNSNVHINNSMYVHLFDPDLETWFKADNKYSFIGGYTYCMSKLFGIGLQLETEKLRFPNYFTVGTAYARRISYGAHFQCKYPETNFHFTGGGFLNFSNLKCDDLEFKLSGIENGLFFGPELSVKSFCLAFLFNSKFSYYNSKENSDEAILILNPRFSLKLTYCLNSKIEG